jgi:hypothetical protein
LDYAVAGGQGVQPHRAAGEPCDWRAAVESIEIDPAYDGQVFRPAQVDAPAGRRTLVAGHYTVPAPPSTTAVAVRITDVLGAEVMVERTLNAETLAG